MSGSVRMIVELNLDLRLFRLVCPDSEEKEYSVYFTGMLMTNPPMTSLILKSRLGLSGWALWHPMQAWVTARSG